MSSETGKPDSTEEIQLKEFARIRDIHSDFESNEEIFASCGWSIAETSEDEDFYSAVSVLNSSGENNLGFEVCPPSQSLEGIQTVDLTRKVSYLQGPSVRRDPSQDHLEASLTRSLPSLDHLEKSSSRRVSYMGGLTARKFSSLKRPLTSKVLSPERHSSKSIRVGDSSHVQLESPPHRNVSFSSSSKELSIRRGSTLEEPSIRRVSSQQGPSIRKKSILVGPPIRRGSSLDPLEGPSTRSVESLDPLIGSSKQKLQSLDFSEGPSTKRVTSLEGTLNRRVSSLEGPSIRKVSSLKGQAIRRASSLEGSLTKRILSQEESPTRRVASQERPPTRRVASQERPPIRRVASIDPLEGPSTRRVASLDTLEGPSTRRIASLDPLEGPSTRRVTSPDPLEEPLYKKVESLDLQEGPSIRRVTSLDPLEGRSRTISSSVTAEGSSGNVFQSNLSELDLHFYDEPSDEHHDCFSRILAWLISFLRRQSRQIRHSVCYPLFLAALMILPYSAGYMGCMYYYLCDGCPKLPHLMYLLGIFGMLILFLHLTAVLSKRYFSPHLSGQEFNTWMVSLCVPFYILLVIELSTVFLCEPVFVPPHKEFCAKVFYNFAYNLNIAVPIVIFLLILIHLPGCYDPSEAE